jgi:hypothetical protein
LLKLQIGDKGEVAWSLKINKINKEQNKNSNLMQTLV